MRARAADQAVFLIELLQAPEPALGARRQAGLKIGHQGRGAPPSPVRRLASSSVPAPKAGPAGAE